MKQKLIRLLFWVATLIALFAFIVSGQAYLEDRAANGASLAMLYFPLTMGIGIFFSGVVALIRLGEKHRLNKLEIAIGWIMSVLILVGIILAFSLAKRH